MLGRHGHVPSTKRGSLHEATTGDQLHSESQRVRGGTRRAKQSRARAQAQPSNTERDSTASEGHKCCEASEAAHATGLAGVKRQGAHHSAKHLRLTCTQCMHTEERQGPLAPGTELLGLSDEGISTLGQLRYLQLRRCRSLAR